MFFMCLGLGVVSMVLFLSQRKPQVTLKAVFLKAITSVMFLLTGISGFYENIGCPKSLAMLFIAGGICGLLGDIWLDLKYIAKESEKQLLNAGFTSFLVCHVFFSAGMLINCQEKLNGVLWGVGGLVLTVIFCLVSEKLIKADYGQFKLIAAVYTGVLGFATALSLYLAIESSFALSATLRCVGMVLFLLSDAVLSKIYFCKGGNTRVLVVVNHTLYYSAQFILMSLLYIY